MAKVPLDALTGETARSSQTPEQTLHAVRLWKAALKQMPGSDPEPKEERTPE